MVLNIQVVDDSYVEKSKLEYLNGRGRAILLEQYERGEKHFPIKSQLELIKKHQGSSLCIIYTRSQILFWDILPQDWKIF